MPGNQPRYVALKAVSCTGAELQRFAGKSDWDWEVGGNSLQCACLAAGRDGGTGLDQSQLSGALVRLWWGVRKLRFVVLMIV